MKLAVAILASVVLFVVLAALPSAPSRPAQQVPSGREVVSAAAYTSLEPAARGKDMQLAVVLKIRNGFHINAHKASAEYLIPTTLTGEPPAGFKFGPVVYPEGGLHTFAFSKTPLNVYQDKVVLHMPVSVLASAPIGAQPISLKLRYQACNNELCLPPVRIDVEAKVDVAANPGAARPAHAELFSSP